MTEVVGEEVEDQSYRTASTPDGNGTGTAH